MGAADIVIKQALEPPKGANPDRLEKEKEDVRNELLAMQALTSAFSDIKKQGTDFEKSFGQGRIQGIVSMLTGKTGLNPAVEPYKKQQMATAAALMKMTMAGARSGQLLNQFVDMLPNEGSNWQEYGNGIHTSVINALNKRAAITGIPFSEQEVRNLTNSIIVPYMPSEERSKYLKTQLQQKTMAPIILPFDQQTQQPTTPASTMPLPGAIP